jgi:hypothetical protein
MNSLIVQQFLVLLLSYVYSVSSFVFYMKLIGIARNQPVFSFLYKIRIHAYNFFALFKYQISFYICKYALTRILFIHLFNCKTVSLFLSLCKVRNGWAHVIHHTFNVSGVFWKCWCQTARKREKGTDRQTKKIYDSICTFIPRKDGEWMAKLFHLCAEFFAKFIRRT